MRLFRSASNCRFSLIRYGADKMPITAMRTMSRRRTVRKLRSWVKLMEMEGGTIKFEAERRNPPIK